MIERLWQWIKRKPKRFNQLLLIESNPFGETVFPFQFAIEQTNCEIEMTRLAKSVWKRLENRKVGYWTSFEVVFLKQTHEDKVGFVPKMEETFQMGRYSMSRKVYPTTSVDLTD
jgi:hypothetical protein